MIASRIWDLRNYKEVHCYRTPIDYGEVVFSQRRYVAAAAGNTVQVARYLPKAVGS